MHQTLSAKIRIKIAHCRKTKRKPAFHPFKTLVAFGMPAFITNLFSAVRNLRIFSLVSDAKEQVSPISAVLENPTIS